jgi:hypothetical protein
MHLKPISRELRRELYGRRRGGGRKRYVFLIVGATVSQWTEFHKMRSSLDMWYRNTPCIEIKDDKYSGNVSKMSVGWMNSESFVLD